MKKSTAALLKAVARPIAPSKPGADIPDLVGHEKLADDLHEAVVKQKDAEAERKMAEGDLLPLVESEYLKLAQSNSFTKTINVPGKSTGGVQITFQDRFSPIAIENEAELRALDPKFDEHFEQKRSIALKGSDLDVLQLLIKKLGKNISDIFAVSLKDTSDNTIDLLVSKLGEEDFAKLFDVQLSLVAKDHLDEKIHEIPTKARGFIKQAKGAVKLKASK